MIYDLIESVSVCGDEYPIRWEYRPIIRDIFPVLSDEELAVEERIWMALDIFYPTFYEMPQDYYPEAVERLFWFLNCGEDDGQKKQGRKLIDWEQDFPLIVGPISKVLGYDIRSVSIDTHYLTFMSAFSNVGDCTWAQVVRIRDRQASGKKLDKQDLEWYRRNRQLVDFKDRHSGGDIALLEKLSGFEARTV